MNWLTNLFKREATPAKKYHCFSLDCSQRFSTPKARSEHEEQVHGVMRVEGTENECHG